MTTFWTGAALAADYGQDRVYPLGVATRSSCALTPCEVIARRKAFDTLNKAISRAVQAQLDDQQADIQLSADGCLDGGCLEDDCDDLLMHCGGMECFFCVLPDKPLGAGGVACL